MKRIFIVLSSDEEQLPLKLMKLIRIGLLGEVGSHAVVAPHIDAELDIAIATARHIEVPLIGIVEGRMLARRANIPMIEIISDFTQDNPRLNEIFSITASPIMDYSKELNELIKQEYFSFFQNNKEANQWKWRKIPQTKFNRQVKRTKWQTCRSQL